MTADITDLKSCGLTGVHVADDFIRLRLSPLKMRKDPAWVNMAGHDPDQDGNCKLPSSSELSFGHTFI